MGDLGAVLRWVFGLASEMQMDADGMDLSQLGPLPCEISLSLHDEGYAATFSLERDGLMRLLESARALED